ncbi:gamma-glutamyltransferase [Reyranella sp. MMS21-HV4-11]|jgi:gamma-glutamyltranspeptidase/glutathione hydrolase|uniref:Glutathione hydrolase proenzyme n=1 Tax=Reyranella humidisoli TaxID=2849149 RepID=A0ABS6IF45_9HYPH|nr:gamma-glutamyltransferase [Reyranella sp. MMS21-HV4-11]MBU8872946.1 gamma-glutamyltransferase [Reyranella sp. MMS21-HV4-11]
MTLRRLLGVALLLVAVARVPAVQAAPQSMVAAAHPLAVEAGVEILRRGGTAVDAAIAVQMVLGVVEPHASGIGGGGFLLHYDGTSRAITVYDGRETAPAGATPGMFLAPDGRPLGYREAVASGISVGVPGLMAMLELAHREQGKLAWSDLFQPAIAAARNGFPVSPRLAAWLQRMPALRDEAAIRETYFHVDGSPRERGDRIVNRALADTMGLIASRGANVLYQGPIAAEIVGRVRGHRRPGTLSAADLADYKPIKREAVCGAYRVWTVCGMPPPSSGGIAVLQVLGLLQPFDIQRDAPNDLRAVHLIAEASRLAFADRDRYVADPAFVDVPVAGLLSPGYLDERRKLMSPDRSMGKVGPGVPPGYVERGTSHISIVDRWGNAVSFTTTIEAPFGAHMMVRGFLLNNELTDFSPRPELDGKPVANRVQPGKRPRSSMSPTFVLDRDGRLVAALGSAGGARIIGDTLQTLIGLLDWDLSAQAAVDLSRVANLNGATELEEGTPIADQADALRKLGHEVQVRRHEGGLTAIRRTGDGWEGGADPRRDGVARGE